MQSTPVSSLVPPSSLVTTNGANSNVANSNIGVSTIAPATTPVNQLVALPGSAPPGSDPAPGLGGRDSGVGLLSDVTVSSPQAAADQPQQLQQTQQLQQLQQLQNTQNVNAFLAHLKQQGITIPETSDPILLPPGTANPFVVTPNTPDSMGSWSSNAPPPPSFLSAGSSAGSDPNPSSPIGNPYPGHPHPFLYKGNPDLLVTPDERLQLALKAAQEKEGSDQANVNRLPGSITTTGQSSLSSQTTTGSGMSSATSATSSTSSSTASSEATSQKSASSATGYGRVKEKIKKLLRFVFRKKPSQTKSEASKDASPSAPETKADDSTKSGGILRRMRRMWKWLVSNVFAIGETFANCTLYHPASRRRRAEIGVEFCLNNVKGNRN